MCRLVKTVLLSLPIPILAIGAPTIEFIRFQFDFINFNRILAPAQGKHCSGPKFHGTLRVLTPNQLPPSCLLAGVVFHILLRPSSSLCKFCSPGCAEHRSRMSGPPSRSLAAQNVGEKHMAACQKCRIMEIACGPRKGPDFAIFSHWPHIEFHESRRPP